MEYIASQYDRNPRIGIAIAYFNYKSVDTQRPSQIISSFIKQLCQQLKYLPKDVQDFYEMYNTNARTPTFDKYHSCLATATQSFEETYLIIDALDECREEEREKMIKCLIALVKDLPCVKVFVSSRREPDIVDAFAEEPERTIEIEAESVNRDIALFVKWRVDNLIEEKKLKIVRRQLKDTILETLIANADGM
jgi:hypothetical protein